MKRTALVMGSLALLLPIAAAEAQDVQRPRADPGLVQLDAGGTGFCGVDSNSVVRCAPRAGNPQAAYTTLHLPDSRQAISVSSGATHTCALATGGLAYCWGRGNYGQLGSGSRTDSDQPLRVVAPERFAQLSAGAWHTCAVGMSGALYCWGGNWHGQLGIGNTEPFVTPVLVDSGTPYTIVSAGGIHTCAITRGTVRCWGDQRSGRLGLGHIPPAEVLTPTAIATSDSFIQVSAGHWHSCGLLEVRRVLCWGGGGSGAGADSLGVPHDVGIRDVFQLAAGPRHTCALDRRGTVWCWGANSSGETGAAEPRIHASPIQPFPNLRFRAIAAGGDDFGGFTCALTIGGRARCWGAARPVRPDSQ